MSLIYVPSNARIKDSPEFHTILLAVVSCRPPEVSYYRIVTGSMSHKLPFHVSTKILFSHQEKFNMMQKGS